MTTESKPEQSINNNQPYNDNENIIVADIILAATFNGISLEELQKVASDFGFNLRDELDMI